MLNRFCAAVQSPTFNTNCCFKFVRLLLNNLIIQGVPLATEPGIEDIATKFEQEYVRCVKNEEECVCSASNFCDTEQRSASQW
jgi:hypothetical protein